MFCKLPLHKEKTFPHVAHDDSYKMFCCNCPTRLVKWSNNIPDSTIYRYVVRYATKDCKPEDLYSVNIYLDNYLIEMYPSYNRPSGEAFRLFKVNYEPVYHSNFIFGTPSPLKIDFENLDADLLKNKVIKYIPFI